MKNIIVMSGDIGSGKSSVATELKQLTGFDIIGTGTIQRAIASKRGLTTLELNEISQTDRSVDDEIDAYVIETGKSQDRLIMDSRLAWHFIPTAFKVFLAVDPVVGAERVFNASRHDENNDSLDITIKNNLKRQTIEDQRFNQLYNIHFRKYGNYDLIIDTSYATPLAIAEKIKDCFNAWLKQQSFSSLWITPKKLLPTLTVKTVDEEAQKLSVFIYNGFIYILQGHSLVIKTHLTGSDLIAANIITEEPNHLLIDGVTVAEAAHKVSLAMLKDWEDSLGFKYTRYPESDSAK
jgi:cytidylate kinase